jgi:hypothetical protein
MHTNYEPSIYKFSQWNFSLQSTLLMENCCFTRAATSREHGEVKLSLKFKKKLISPHNFMRNFYFWLVQRQAITFSMQGFSVRVPAMASSRKYLGLQSYLRKCHRSHYFQQILTLVPNFTMKFLKFRIRISVM